MLLTYQGPFAVYFNRHADAPRVWNVAAVDRAWEICVVSVEICVPVNTVYERTPHVTDHHGPPLLGGGDPSAYFIGVGTVKIDGQGKARITALEETP